MTDYSTQPNHAAASARLLGELFGHRCPACGSIRLVVADRRIASSARPTPADAARRCLACGHVFTRPLKED